jgi:peroxiredoxin
MMKRRVFPAVLTVLILLMTTLALAVSPGKPAPDFTLVDKNGQVIKLSDFQGRPVVLNAWATWCPFCIEEIPIFQEAHDAVTGAGSAVAFLLVNLSEPFEVARDFLDEEVGTTLTSAYDASAEQKQQFADVDFDTTRNILNKVYRVRGMPTTFFIGADGMVESVKIGPLTEGELADHLAGIGVEWNR